MTSKVKKGLLIAAGVIILIAALNALSSGSGSKSSSSTTSSDEETNQTKVEEVATTEAEAVSDNGVPSISATELYGKYDSNEIAAAGQYEGTKMNITGTISDFSQDLLSDNPQVKLEGGNWVGEVVCEFSKSDAKVLASLSKGQKVTINGTIGEFTICVLDVNNCKLVSK